MTTANVDREQLQVDIGGMTCSSCAARIEKRLNRMDGVTAAVNYATEQARVTYSPGVTPDELIAQIEAAGYTASLPRSKSSSDGPSDDDSDTRSDMRSVRSLRDRLLVSTLLTAPVVGLAMVSAFQFRNWQWLSLMLAAPVVVWGALPFHRAAWTNLRHAAATMDTLISVGVIAAFAWSLYALFVGDAGQPNMTMSFNLTPDRGGGQHDIYLEVASAVTVFILAGRYFEARA